MKQILIALLLAFTTSTVINAQKQSSIEKDSTCLLYTSAEGHDHEAEGHTHGTEGECNGDHKHDKQSDCSDSELSGDRPEEDEKSDPCKGVFDAL